MLTYDEESLWRFQQALDHYCPSPEADLIRIGKTVAELPDSSKTALIRRLVFDHDDLISQIRWHLGQAIALMETQPELFEVREDDEILKQLGGGMSTGVLLLLRGYIRDVDRVLFSDLSESRRGGTVAGWIFHMMIDNAIYRVIAALDRIAHILWYAAELPMEQKGQPVRIYFRSGKIKRLDQIFNCSESHELLKIAESPLLDYLNSYRDGLTHNFKTYSSIAGSPPTDYWENPDGELVRLRVDDWDAETLFALARAAYHQLLDALSHTVKICEKKWPLPDSTI